MTTQNVKPRWSLKRGGRLQQVPFVEIKLVGEILVFWKKWSLTRGGHLQEVVAQGGSTVVINRVKINDYLKITTAPISC